MKMLVLGRVKRGGGTILVRRRLFSNEGKEILSHDLIVGDVVVVPSKLGTNRGKLLEIDVMATM